MENRLRANQQQLRKFLRDNERYATHATPRKPANRRQKIGNLIAIVLIGLILGSLAFWIGVKC